VTPQKVLPHLRITTAGMPRPVLRLHPPHWTDPPLELAIQAAIIPSWSILVWRARASKSWRHRQLLWRRRLSPQRLRACTFPPRPSHRPVHRALDPLPSPSASDTRLND